MKKRLLLPIMMVLASFAFAQVGIQTESPNATLDVASKPGVLTAIDGIIAPKLKGSELKAKDALYTALQEGALVFVTEALASADTTVKTKNVLNIGYYYFDGTSWIKLISESASVFVPYVAASGTASNSFNIGDGAGFTKWTFNISKNDGNWNVTNNTYTASKAGFYQFSLQGLVRPSTGNNSFSWNLTYASGQNYAFNSFANLQAGNFYNRGGSIVLYLNANDVATFGGSPCVGCNSTYTVTTRTFSIIYLGS